MKKINIFVIAGTLLLGIYVALSPTIVYAPTPRIVLYFLISFLPSLLFGIEAASKFELKLPGIVFTTAGACAASLGALLLLTYLSKPTEKIAVFHIYDENNNELPLEWDGAVKIPLSSNALTVTKYIDRNTIVLIFPEQINKVKLRIKKSLSSPTYSGVIGYSGNRTEELKIGKELIEEK